MSITRFAVPLLTAAALLPAVPAVAAAEGLSLQLCATVAPGWDPCDNRTECAQVPVPVDYADPGGPSTSPSAGSGRPGPGPARCS